ncbi:MAG: phosphotransferase [Lysobacterales bacterium]
MAAAYRNWTGAIAAMVDARFAAAAPALLRLHGDCHAGNVLWTEAGPVFVDLDTRMGPAVQDGGCRAVGYRRCPRCSKAMRRVPGFRWRRTRAGRTAPDDAANPLGRWVAARWRGSGVPARISAGRRSLLVGAAPDRPCRSRPPCGTGESSCGADAGPRCAAASFRYHDPAMDQRIAPPLDTAHDVPGAAAIPGPARRSSCCTSPSRRLSRCWC